MFHEALYRYLCVTDVLKMTYNKKLITLLSIHGQRTLCPGSAESLAIHPLIDTTITITIFSCPFRTFPPTKALFQGLDQVKTLRTESVVF